MKEFFRRLLGDDAKGEPVDMRIARIEQQARAATEKIAATAERDIQRAWTQYDRIWKLAMTSAAIVAFVALFFGFRTYSDFENKVKQVNESAQVEANKVRTEVVAELNRQFARPEIEALILEKARERIDLTAEPLVESLLSNKLSNVLADLKNASNQIDLLNERIRSAEGKLQEVHPKNQPLSLVKATAEFRIKGVTNFSGFERQLEAVRRRRDGFGSPSLEFNRTVGEQRVIDFRMNCYDANWGYEDKTNGIVRMRIHFCQSDYGPLWNLPTNATPAIFDEFKDVRIIGFGLFETNYLILGGELAITLNSSVRTTYPIPMQHKKEGNIHYFSDTTNAPNVLIDSL